MPDRAEIVRQGRVDGLRLHRRCTVAGDLVVTQRSVLVVVETIPSAPVIIRRESSFSIRAIVIDGAGGVRIGRRRDHSADETSDG